MADILLHSTLGANQLANEILSQWIWSNFLPWVSFVNREGKRAVMPTRVVIIIGLLFIVGCVGSSAPTKRSELEREFSSEFGFLPSSKVTDIRCKIVHVRKTWNKWFVFTLDQETVDKIKSRGFNTATDEPLRRSSMWAQDLEASNVNEPSWWKRPGRANVQLFFSENQASNFNKSYSYIWTDASNHLVYARAAAWD